MNQHTHILIIEDDPAVAQSLRAGLERDGYRITWATTGAQGLHVARELGPQLIILDVRLPDGSGLDFCRQMRELHLRQPILMLTVRGEGLDKVLGLKMGADDYVTKPYSLRELLSRIRALLRRAYGELASTESDTLYAGDLVLDRSRGQVRRGDPVLSLTPTEFKLLVYLARHAGQALSTTRQYQAGSMLRAVAPSSAPYQWSAFHRTLTRTGAIPNPLLG